MSLRILNRMPHGNAGAVEIADGGDMPEVRFAPAPHGGPECMWFFFRILESEPSPERQTKVRLVLKHFGNLLGGSSPSDCLPVCRPAGQAWIRLKRGEEQRCPDGQVRAVWQVPHPNPWTDVAFCYPYGPQDIEALLDHSKGYWHRDAIGLSQGGREIVRLSNAYGAPGSSQPGLYLIAGQHAGETPGSLVLDGMLQHFSQVRKAGYTVWAVPICDIDGVMAGDYGKDRFPYDLNRAWGSPPMRHEALALRHDAARWRERCKPILALDLHAPGACEKEGVYCFLPDPDKEPEMAAEAGKWANALQSELKSEFAAADFKRVARHNSRWETPTFAEFMRAEMKVCSFVIETPYALAGATVLTRKHYRDIGMRLAAGICRRHSGS